MYSVILCGGSGTRLWPLSRKNFPKQFLKLYSDRSLLQETYERMKEIMPKEHIFFITNKENFFNVYNQVKEIDPDYDKEQIIVEPKGMNTAPAIALSVKYLVEKFKADSKAPIIFLPSDHYIKDKERYLKLVKMAMLEVGTYIGTIGITPTSPHTGFGYMKKGKKKGNYFKVEEFKEKPSRETAEKYVKSGQYVWNGGMYIFSANTFMKELSQHSPEIHKLAKEKLDKFLADFEKLPSISIDYAISEKSDNVITFEDEFGWSDIGSFECLADITNGENCKHVGIDSKNVYVHSESGRLVATVGVEDLIVVETRDSILIHKKGRGEDVKQVVDLLKENGLQEVEHNLLVHRPWGKFEVLIDNATYKVKKITVYSGEKLSLQAHYHRAEHWIVVKGTAKIVNGDKEIFLRENESTYIPALNTHRLENPGKTELELIEVQTGNYLEEDDIIRFEDVYNRIEK